MATIIGRPAERVLRLLQRGLGPWWNEEAVNAYREAFGERDQ